MQSVSDRHLANCCIYCTFNHHPPRGGTRKRSTNHASRSLPPHQNQRPPVPRSRHPRIRLLLLPQEAPPQPRPLPRQGPPGVGPARPSALPPASRRRGPRIRPARHLHCAQRARHPMHFAQRGELTLLRTPDRLGQRPRPAHRPPPHPDGPRHLQRTLGRRPPRQRRHRPSRPHPRSRRRPNPNHRSRFPDKSRHPERSP